MSDGAIWIIQDVEDDCRHWMHQACRHGYEWDADGHGWDTWERHRLGDYLAFDSLASAARYARTFLNNEPRYLLRGRLNPVRADGKRTPRFEVFDMVARPLDDADPVDEEHEDLTGKAVFCYTSLRAYSSSSLLQTEDPQA